MTAQIGDIYKYKNREYSIVAMSSPINFKPEDYGLEPQSRCTACWNGYWCEYHIENDRLLLKNLFMFNSEGNYPLLNGVGVVEQTYHEGTSYKLGEGKPKKVMLEDHMGHREYRNVNLPIKYTGKILVGDGFIRDYYIHMGYQRAWAYNELLEFVFEKGSLIETIDHSDMAEKIRCELKSNDTNIKNERENIVLLIERSFSLDMKDKAWWIK